jgi:Flp pilus assembly protein TadG
MSLLMFTTARLRRGQGYFASESGIALIEFALVLPFLLLVIFGMIDLGKAVSYWNDETHLANQAARYASVNGCPAACGGSTINTYVLNTASTAELKNNATFAIAFADSNGKFPGETGYNSGSLAPQNHCAGQSVRVTVAYPYNLLSFVSSRINFIGPITIRASSTQRIEKDWGKASGVYVAGTDHYTATGASPDPCP